MLSLLNKVTFANEIILLQRIFKNGLGKIASEELVFLTEKFLAQWWARLSSCKRNSLLNERIHKE